MDSIVIIDYGMGNLHSAAKAVARAVENADVIISSNPDEIKKADRVVFPGVGAMRDCMSGLQKSELDDVIKQVAKEKPFLAICVGMQALMDHSEENNGVDCLGLFSGDVRYFGDSMTGDAGEQLKVPHMGWNQVAQTKPHPLWAGIPDESRFYFVHSYYVDAKDENVIAGATDYGVKFAASIARDNIFAVQFHPEKSHRAGLTLLANFARWNGENQC
ncbi:MAG: imidazole glycerol phosphate synthase subunit HisH [Gammaproteobacteria bacterium]|nr:imidazole glycerol phosphate synthase subunit HisH [Gammaproteobacteria bacterium]